ncbi:uncharacterized protein LOC128982172 [Macrosteles quadrilineatus]|uniref:uncharacterized protein LOC128982172 n=1 Tax=Macrosteles quadrilineatus TaxID=74068 RepID=UPI0023E14804|nr:uncharacterized protein LOC128982172 [Macrosteles quadrilineatus]
MEGFMIVRVALLVFVFHHSLGDPTVPAPAAAPTSGWGVKWGRFNSVKTTVPASTIGSGWNLLERVKSSVPNVGGTAFLGEQMAALKTEVQTRGVKGTWSDLTDNAGCLFKNCAGAATTAMQGASNLKDKGGQIASGVGQAVLDRLPTQEALCNLRDQAGCAFTAMQDGASSIKNGGVALASGVMETGGIVVSGLKGMSQTIVDSLPKQIVDNFTTENLIILLKSEAGQKLLFQIIIGLASATPAFKLLAVTLSSPQVRKCISSNESLKNVQPLNQIFSIINPEEEKDKVNEGKDKVNEGKGKVNEGKDEAKEKSQAIVMGLPEQITDSLTPENVIKQLSSPTAQSWLISTIFGFASANPAFKILAPALKNPEIQSYISSYISLESLIPGPTKKENDKEKGVKDVAKEEDKS